MLWVADFVVVVTVVAFVVDAACVGFESFARGLFWVIWFMRMW